MRNFVAAHTLASLGLGSEELQVTELHVRRRRRPAAREERPRRRRVGDVLALAGLCLRAERVAKALEAQRFVGAGDGERTGALELERLHSPGKETCES